MIKFRLHDGHLVITLGSSGYTAFNNSLQVIKDAKFRFNARTQEWFGPWFKRDEIKEALENYDTIDDNISQEDIEALIGRIDSKKAEINALTSEAARWIDKTTPFSSFLWIF